MPDRRSWCAPLAAAVCWLAFAALPAAADPLAGTAPPAPDAAATGTTPQEPVRITAEMAEYLNKEGVIEFTGSVVAAQADSTMTADRMSVTLSRPEPKEGAPAAVAAGSSGRRITSIVALGNVSFRQVDLETKKERYATGDKGVYDMDRRVVTLTGNARLIEDKNVVEGEEVVFQTESKKVVVKGKVRLTVFPDEKKDTGQKP